MIVYVETNFLLELAFEQEDVTAAESILILAENKTIALAIPAVALVEPFATIRYRNSERREALDTWSHTLNRFKENRVRDLGLLTAKKRLNSALADAYSDVADLVVRQSTLLDEVVDRVLGVAAILPLGAAEIRRSIGYRQLGLDAVDSLIFTAIIASLENASSTESSCFVSRDKKGFANKMISDELASYGSRYISTFTNAVAFIQAAQAAGEPPA